MKPSKVDKANEESRTEKDQGYLVCGRLSSWSSLRCAPEFFSQARDVVGNQCRCAVLNQHIENFVVLSPLCVCQRQVVDYKSAKTERRTVVFFKRLEGVVRIFRVVVIKCYNP